MYSLSISQPISPPHTTITSTVTSTVTSITVVSIGSIGDLQSVDACSDTSSNSLTLPFDYSEQRTVPITIPSYENKEQCRQRFIVSYTTVTTATTVTTTTTTSTTTTTTTTTVTSTTTTTTTTALCVTRQQQLSSYFYYFNCMHFYLMLTK